MVLKEIILNHNKDEKNPNSKNKNLIKRSNNKKDLIKYSLKFLYGKINQNNYNIHFTQELGNILKK